MNSFPPLITGFVPTLEALPLIAAALSSATWRMRPCSSYGRIIWHLLTDQLAAGLLPWELCVTELLCKPGQGNSWSIPMVLHGCPPELALSQRAVNMVYPPKVPKRGAKKRLNIGLEGRFSLTRHQVLAWQSKVAPYHLEAPSFKFLPMELLQKGLDAEFIDGFVAPIPWGLQAAQKPGIYLDDAFEPGKFAHHLVFVCNRAAATACSAELASLPGLIAEQRRMFADEAKFRGAAAIMTKLGFPHCDADLLWKSAKWIQPRTAGQADMKPDHSWFEKQFRLLTERLPAAAQLQMSEIKATLLELPL